MLYAVAAGTGGTVTWFRSHGDLVPVDSSGNSAVLVTGWRFLVAEWVHLQSPAALTAEDASAHVHGFAEAPAGEVTGPRTTTVP